MPTPTVRLPTPSDSVEDEQIRDDVSIAGSDIASVASLDIRVIGGAMSKQSHIPQDVLEVLWADIENITLPSWVEKPPPNFGSKSHGKLKADQWRTIGTVHLVITLVRLWGALEPGEWESKLLRNFLDLSIAVECGARRNMTEDVISTYESYMGRYLSGLL